MEKAFEDNEEWKECIIEQYDGDNTKIINLDVFSVINDVFNISSHSIQSLMLFMPLIIVNTV